MPIGDASLILRDVTQNSSFLNFGQEARCHGCIWEEDERDETNDDRDTAEKHEHNPPTRERGVDLLETIADDAADDLANPQAAIPEAEARGLLRFGIPLGAYEHQRRRYGGFENAEKDASCEEAAVVVRSGGASSRNSLNPRLSMYVVTLWHTYPEYDIRTQPFTHGNVVENVAWQWSAVNLLRKLKEIHP